MNNPETGATAFVEQVEAFHHARISRGEWGPLHQDGERAAAHVRATCKHAGSLSRLSARPSWWCSYCGSIVRDSDKRGSP